MSWLQKLLPPKIKRSEGVKKSIPEGLWSKCPACEAVLYSTDLENNQNVCPKCNHHHRIRARARLDLLLDPEGRFEIGAEVILKATKVDGVYDSDPKKNARAKRFEQITYLDALQRQLKVMDSTAFSLCMDNKMPIIVFDFFKAHNLKRVILGEKIGTLVS